MKKVRIKLHELMGKHKIRSINQLSKETGISRPTLTRLYDEETKQLDFATIGILCEFFDCGIGDLLVLEESDSQESE
ncbi:helix-turn-helix transcriptional regulator [Priestia flexa]|uniref:helix-turn-helix domain-containing protein n=1 Tax=Priestia flexa TaxID=86664 RepID=UPI000CC4C13F|nr:helix-turn-helix transcriptional regulator [Priestia flexa]MEC0666328.1 helix-turn-helix transcriptional regulator [Priestia flexa]